MRFQSLFILCATTAALSGLALFAAPEQTFGAWLHVVFAVAVMGLVATALVKVREVASLSVRRSVDTEVVRPVVEPGRKNRDSNARNRSSSQHQSA